MMARAQAVEAARSWAGTPYVLRGRVKHGGCDCGTFLLEYMCEIGAEKTLEQLPDYKADWWLHTTDNTYFRTLKSLARQATEGMCNNVLFGARPGDILLFRHHDGSENFTHGAVVLKFPMILHAVRPNVRETNALTHVLTAYKPFALFNPWESPDV